MSLDAALAVMRAQSDSLWPGIEASVPITWPNEPFDKPVDPNGVATPFVAVELIWNPISDGSIGSPGSNLARRFGHFWVYAFTAEGLGAARAFQLASEAAGMFELKNLGAVTFEFAEPSGEAKADDGNYYCQSISIPFYFDETA